jgi:hypothetical protein
VVDSPHWAQRAIDLVDQEDDMKRAWGYSILFVLMLALGSLACNLGAQEQPTATPSPTIAPTATLVPTPTMTPPPPTNTPEPSPTVVPTATESPAGVSTRVREDFVSVEHPDMGVRLAYPKEWSYDGSFYMTLPSSQDLEALNGGGLPDALIVFVMGAQPEELGLDTESPEEMLGEFDADAEFTVVAGPTPTEINGVPVQLVEYEALMSIGKPGRGKIATFNSGDWAAVLIAIAPADLWEEFAADVDAVIESVEIFEGAGWGDWSYPAPEGVYRGNLAPNDLVEDEFAPAEAHSWRIEGYMGIYLTAVLTPAGTEMDVKMTLVDPEGRVLLDMDHGFSGEPEVIANYLLPVDGEYELVVAEYYGAGGGYSLQLDLSDEMKVVVPPGAEEMGPIFLGEPETGTLAEGQSHAWTIRMNAGDAIDLLVTPLDKEMDLTVSVYAPDGSLVLDRYDGAFSGEPELVEAVYLQADGVYLILVKEYWDAPGDYTLLVTEGVAAPGAGAGATVAMGPIAYGETRDSRLENGPMIHEWVFAGASGDTITIIAQPGTAAGDLVLVLIDPSGSTVFDLDETGGGEAERITSYRLTKTGSYVIQVREWWEEATGYSISIQTK